MTQPDSGYSRRRYEAEVYAETAGKSAGKFFRPDPAAVAGKYSTKSAEIYTTKLQAEGGGYRDGLAPSDMRYESMPHQQLAEMVKASSPEEVDEQGVIVNDLGNAFGEMSTALRQGVAKEQAGWQGNGASSAFGYFTTLAGWADTSRDAAFLSANRYSQTSAALVDARNKMPEPAGRTVEESVATARRQLVGGDWEAASATMNDMQNQAALQHQAQQQAAAVLAQRDVMLHSGGSTQPVYATPTAPAGTGQRTAPQFPSDDHTVAAHAGGVGPMGAPTGTVRTTAGIAPPSTALPSGAGSATGAVPPGGWADAGGGWGRSPAPTVPGSSTAASAGAGMMPVAPGQAEQNRTAPRPGSGGGRTGSSPYGGGGGGGRAAGGAGGRLGGAAGAERAPGRRAGIGEPGARAAAESAGSGRAGAAGKAGTSGAPGVGPAGGKKKDEDKDHERAAYLLEDDPDSIFGLDGATDENGNRISPPVIGG
ncbi:hypothetical protein [Amycolatopsis granulosa]|uniref:hypothetical protein n=1 Tax=Amycolatopsis granulosa TaxID=185684 RepID=UPI001423FF24|nr:hypothetical protein [Amycolatopsis granulosa]NIH85389.1 hypothetical protein [Amycolatopsis granulosa]